MGFEANDNFAQRFKALRTRSGYTQQQMANLFNVTRPCICYWENGKRVPDYIKLAEICRFFDVTSDYLLGVSDINTGILYDDNKKKYDYDKYLDMSKLNDEYKRELKNYYLFLLDKQTKKEK